MALKAFLRTVIHKCLRCAQRIVPPSVKQFVRYKLVLDKAMSHKAYLRRKGEYAQLLSEKEVINVAFQVLNLGCWKCDSVLRLMMKHPRFNPVIWLIPERNQPEDKVRINHEACRKYFAAQGAKCCSHYSMADFPEEDVPDVIFTAKPHAHDIFSPHTAALFKKPVCCVHYGMHNTNDACSYDSPINNMALFNFCENDFVLSQARELMRNGGRNSIATGYPTNDLFLYPETPFPDSWKELEGSFKRVIWAPHWSIYKNFLPGYESSTFLQMAEPMLRNAERFKGSIQFAFKPHPTLYPMLLQHPDWGEERTKAYYRKWAEMENTQYEDGEYIGLFMHSDAIIHDCGSFILEYLFANKPCMYLQDGSGYANLNSMTLDALKCYTIGHEPADIERFLEQIERGEDNEALREMRERFIEEYLRPPHGKTAAQNIVDCLLGEVAQN